MSTDLLAWGRKWASLLLVLAGAVVFAFIVMAGRFWRVNSVQEAFLVFLCFAVAAVVLSILDRKSREGKAGLATSLTLLALTVLVAS